MTTSSRCAIALPLIAFVSTANILFAAPLYHIIDVGNLGGSNGSVAAKINNNGVAIGSSSLPGNLSTHGYMFSNGTMTDLGVLPGGNSFTGALGINDLGQIVGYSGSNAFSYSNGTMTNLGKPSNSTEAFAIGINNSGQIAGKAILSNSSLPHAFTYTNGTYSVLQSSLALFNSESVPSAINSSGQIVGMMGDVSSGAHAFSYTNGSVTDLGTLGGRNSSANSINASGQIVGYAYLADNLTQHATLYQNGILTDLGTLGGAFTNSSANGINRNGQIVGQATDNSNNGHAFIYSNGIMTDLNQSVDASGIGWTLKAANAINDNGWIVGVGTNPQGQSDGFILVPLPEPSSLCLSALAFVGIMALNKLNRTRKRLNS